MANVFDDKPDARQASDPAILAAPAVSRFRPRYRALSAGELARADELKAAFSAVEALINELGPGRYTSLALTALEESCMWAIKGLTE